MKKIVISLITVFWAFSVFAAKHDIDPIVLKAFQKDFLGVKEVEWITTKNYYEAVFNFNGHQVAAFYQLDGKLLGLTRNISLPDLPIMLQASLRNNYNRFWVTDLLELSNDEGTTYYIALENADIKLVLKSVSTTSWDLFKKFRK